MKKQIEGPKDEAKKATAEEDEVDLSDSEYEEYSEYVTDSQVSIWLCFAVPGACIFINLWCVSKNFKMTSK